MQSPLAGTLEFIAVAKCALSIRLCLILLDKAQKLAKNVRATTTVADWRNLWLGATTFG
jgi:hypothetical protein